MGPGALEEDKHIREQDRCSHAVFSEEPQLSSVRCSAAPSTAAKRLLFPCMSIYMPRMQIELRAHRYHRGG